MCFACRVVARRLGLPLVPLQPIRLCPLGGALYSLLLRYKESPVADDRRQCAAAVRALCRGYLVEAGDGLRVALGGSVDLVVPVPSTARPGPSPLARVDGLGRDVTGALPQSVWAPLALQRRPETSAPTPPSHMRPDARGFSVSADAPTLAGCRVLLLDDLYVSGSRAQSAAAALRLAGARAVVIVAVGRVLRPDRVPAHRAFLQRHARRGRELAENPGAMLRDPSLATPSTRRAGPPAPPRPRTARD